MKIIEELDSEIKEMLKDKTSGKKYEYDESLKPRVKAVLDDIDLNHNNSFAVEIYLKNKSNLNKIAINYRGNKITYNKLFQKAFLYAKSLKQLGYGKGSEVPVCAGNIPEFLYMYLAVGFIGAKLNSLGEWFDLDYTKYILNNTKSDYVFVSDDIYPDMKEKIEQSNVKNVVLFSLANSLPFDENGERYDPYESIDNKFYKITNKFKLYKRYSKKPVLSESVFENLGLHYNGKVIEDCNLDDPVAISYTSGTTSPGIPKAVLHANRSYMTLSRFKDKDVSGLTSMENLIVMHHVPTYTHMELCSLGDSLYQGCTLALEPFYSKEFHKYALLINKPNYAPGSVGFWMDTCKNLNENPEFKNVDMPYLIAPTITGEAATAGEEKYFYYTSRKHKFGTGKLPYPLAPVAFSIGGGTSEASGIFTTLFKRFQEKIKPYTYGKDGMGLTTLPFATIEVLDENGNYCKNGEPGTLVCNTPTSMLGYYYHPENYSNPWITDKNGKKWLSLGTYSYKINDRQVKMKGRLNSTIKLDNTEIPYYSIEDIVLKDTKNVMSCTLVSTFHEFMGEVYVLHVEFSPRTKKNDKYIIDSIVNRLGKYCAPEISDKLFIRVHSNEESFETAPSGKRDTGILEKEGITKKCLSVSRILKMQSEAKTDNKVMEIKPKK